MKKIFLWKQPLGKLAMLRKQLEACLLTHFKMSKTPELIPNLSIQCIILD